MHRVMASMLLMVLLCAGCAESGGDRKECLRELDNIRWDAKEDGLGPLGELKTTNWCMSDPSGDIWRLRDWRDKAAKRLCDHKLAPVRQDILGRKDRALALMFHKQCFCCSFNWFGLVMDARMLRDIGKWEDRQP